jgi:hypothetical protein
MAGGFRVTEDGSQRVDQLLQLRLTQEFFPLYVTSSLNAIGTVTALAEKAIGAKASLAGTLVFIAVPQITMNTQVTLGSTLTAAVSAVLLAEGLTNGSSIGTIGANSSLILTVFCDLQADSASTIYPQLIEAALALVGSSGSMTANGGFLAIGIADLNSLGTLNGTAYMIQNAIVSQDTNRRVTEDGGIRIIFSGEFRSVVGEANLIDSLLEATPTIIPFAGSIYGRRNNQWGLVTPQIKHNGSWYIPQIYVNNNNTWKRVS